MSVFTRRPGDKPYTVVGYFADKQKYCDVFFVKNPSEAERKAEEIGVSIVAVIQGNHCDLSAGHYVMDVGE